MSWPPSTALRSPPTPGVGLGTRPSPTRPRQRRSRLREAYRQRTPSPVTSEVAHRDLSDYDRVFGLIDDDVAADEAV